MTQPQDSILSLAELFAQINIAHFDGFLDFPNLHWNARLRTSAGRFIPGSRKWIHVYPPAIEIASYLLEEEKAYSLIYDTLAHEMIHYWLWIRKCPYGHTREFLSKMKQMGVSRYNPVPRLRPFKYVYLCQNCQRTFPARKKLGLLACAQCCKVYSDGKYDNRFRLVLSQQLRANEFCQTVD